MSTTREKVLDAIAEKPRTARQIAVAKHLELGPVYRAIRLLAHAGKIYRAGRAEVRGRGSTRGPLAERYAVTPQEQPSAALESSPPAP